MKRCGTAVAATVIVGVAYIATIATQEIGRPA
jgi:hypothetical protein